MNKIKSHYIIAAAYFLILCIWFYVINEDHFTFDFQSTSTNPFYFKPRASIGFQNFVLQHFNKVFTHLLCIVVIPFSIYLLLVTIYSRYISPLWASFIALLSLSVYEKLSFHAYLLNIFKLPTIDRFISAPLIFDFPLPGSSTLYFLIVYFFITQYKKIRLPLITLFSLVVAADFYINAISLIKSTEKNYIHLPG